MVGVVSSVVEEDEDEDAPPLPPFSGAADTELVTLIASAISQSEDAVLVSEAPRAKRLEIIHRMGRRLLFGRPKIAQVEQRVRKHTHNSCVAFLTSGERIFQRVTSLVSGRLLRPMATRTRTTTTASLGPLVSLAPAACLALALASCAAEPTGAPEELAVDDTDNDPDEGSGDVVTGAEVPLANAAIAREGDTIVSPAGVAAIVPKVGDDVLAIAELDDGTSRSLRVVHDVDGVHVDEGAAAVAAAATTSPAACADKAFSRMGHRWASTYAWRFRAGTTPSTNSKSGVETALERAAANVSLSRNDCAVAKSNAPAQTYLGRTSLHSQVIGTSTTYKCGTGDGHNVVGFGVLPRGIVGLACVWSTGHRAVEADVKLNDRGYRWFAAHTTPSGCTRSMSVEGVATHEFGHVFGLGHVSEGAHGNLTMSTATRPCTARDASLGRGDVLGLRAIYGP